MESLREFKSTYDLEMAKKDMKLREQKNTIDEQNDQILEFHKQISRIEQ